MSTIVATPGLAPRRRPASRPVRPARSVRPVRPVRPVRSSDPAVRATARATARPAGAAATAPVRLTRRGRLVLTLLLLVALSVVLTVFGATSAATGEAGRPVPTRTVVVQPGDTLWMIAAEVAEPGEVRETVHRIQQLNALVGSGVTVGQELSVPLD